jgi:hypothetical protein
MTKKLGISPLKFPAPANDLPVPPKWFPVMLLREFRSRDQFNYDCVRHQHFQQPRLHANVTLTR